MVVCIFMRLVPDLVLNLWKRTRYDTLCRKLVAHKDTHKAARTRRAQGRTRYAQGCAQGPTQPCARHGACTRYAQGLCRANCAQGCTRCSACVFGNKGLGKPPYMYIIFFTSSGFDMSSFQSI